MIPSWLQMICLTDHPELRADQRKIKSLTDVNELQN